MITHRTALVAAAGAALAVGLVTLPAAAAQRDGTGTCTGAGDGSSWDGRQGRGSGEGRGMGSRLGMGAGMEPGTGMAPGTGMRGGMHTAYPSGELTAEQRTTLAGMAEEEKLARDLYGAFSDRYDDATFARVAASEARHLAAVRALLTTYEITDPTAGLAPGEFAGDETSALYGKLLAQGETSSDEAYAAARAVEQHDLAALETAAAGVTAEDVAHVYARLAAASERHLVAFGG